MDKNADFVRAIELMDAGKSVFITGKAGTGKSTLLKHWIAEQREKGNRKYIVLAPTGIAAINVGGQTLHSFARFPPALFYPDQVEPEIEPSHRALVKQVKTIVIDEISMVSALLFDALDVWLRKTTLINQPMGGKQIIIIGDMFQLPPVVTRNDAQFFGALYNSPYFFNANVPLEFSTVHLTKIYRQNDADKDFVDVLNNVRIGKITPRDLQVLNTRVKDVPDEVDDCITLAPTNAVAIGINKQKLSQYSDVFDFDAFLFGKIKPKDCPADFELKLAVGAQVMFIVNDQERRWYNGTIGTVTGLSYSGSNKEFKSDYNKEIFEVFVESVTVDINGVEHVVDKHLWEMTEYKWNPQKEELELKVIGCAVQFPLKLAWAITCHKSQGLTFENMKLDIGRGFFAHGQAYVTLSRVTSLNGLYLNRPLMFSDLNGHVDSRVLGFQGKMLPEPAKALVADNLQSEIFF